MSKQYKNKELDIHKMAISQDGVSNFFWPVSYNERDMFLQSFMREYMGIVTGDESAESSLPYKFTAKYLITEVLAVFNSDLLNKRFKEHAATPRSRSEWRLWSSLFEDKIPEDPAFMKALKQGPRAKTTLQKFNIIKKVKRVFSLLQIKGKGIGVGYLKLKPVNSHVLKHDIIATQRTELIQEHAATVNQDVVFCRSDRWFDGISEAELEAALQKAPAVLDEKIMTALKKLYNNNGLMLKGTSLEYLQRILRITPLLISIHYQRLLDMSEKLPVNIWTGTGGYIWDALLRHASLHVHDGEVVGHDHGAAVAHVDNSVVALIELWGCKKFICLNKNQAYEMTQHGKNWIFFEPNKPQMRSIKTQREICEFSKFSSSNFKVKTIIVLATLYGGDRVWMGPCAPDIVHADWQARIITQLRSWGYDVILKVHPETPVPPPPILAKLGAKIRSEPLENMMEDGDLVLFDHVYTSVFRSVLSTNMPMVLIDFYDHPWTDKALSLFKNRVSFIQAEFDDENRTAIDWCALKQAIEDAPEKRDSKEFFKYYYG